jgi:hypothetical protein
LARHDTSPTKDTNVGIKQQGPREPTAVLTSGSQFQAQNSLKQVNDELLRHFSMEKPASSVTAAAAATSVSSSETSGIKKAKAPPPPPAPVHPDHQVREDLRS